MLRFFISLLLSLSSFTFVFGQDVEIPVPEFSHASGFYPESLSLEMTHPDTEAIIIYTLDGSEPKIENIGGTTYPYKNQYPITADLPIGEFLENQIETYIYEQELNLQNKSSSDNKISMISQTFDFEPDYFPSYSVAKANVVRAKAIGNNQQESETISATYFVGDEDEFQSDFPIISLSLSETEYYDFYEGIGIAGIDFEEWRLNYPNHQTPAWGQANYKRRGRDHEIEANFEYFEGNNQVFNKKIGVRIHGGASRNYPLKSLRLYARNSYSNNTLNHHFFETEPESAHRRLILRNSGQDRHQTLFRDAFIHNLFSHIKNEYQAYRPINLFINGEYWGIMNIRERYGKQYFEMKYNIDEEYLDFLENNMNVKEGDANHFSNMRHYAIINDLSEEEHYQYMQTQMDMESFIDHFAANIYSANYDWPQNNIEYWRKKVDFNPDAPYGHDGRWRWVLKDMDAGFNGIPTWIPNSTLHNTLYHALRRENTPNWSQRLFQNLIENDQFKNDFNVRLLDLLNTNLTETHIEELIQSFKSKYEPEIQKHINRWSYMESFSNWEFNVNKLLDFASVRNQVVRNHLKDEFDFDEDELSLVVISSNKNQGHVQLNRTLLNSSTPGVDTGTIPSLGNNHIWSGSYFKGLNVKLIAVPQIGYKFSHWSGDSQSTESSIEINLQDHTQVVAHFEPLEEEEIEEIPIHFWVMDSNMPNNTPLESLEATYSFDDLNASIEFYSCLTGYSFDENHELWRKASMERRNRPTSINYTPEGNDDLPFESVNMRGLQVKQPFVSEDQENEMIFNVNTSNFEDIKFSFAAKDEGAVNGFEVSYFDESNNSWSTNMITPNYSLTTDVYNLYEIDFSNVSAASNNPTFQIKLTFTGNDLTQDDGDRVTFNNIAVLGKPITMSVDQPEQTQNIKIYPNPANNRFFIQGIEEGAAIEVYTIQSKLIDRVNYSKAGVNVDHLPKGVYFLNIFQNNKKSNLKLIKN
ncbi:MAG: CotH kinase family protein [Flavobacteriaceae bacterium]|nr:CotH kinase family protein [Flavobacteriaceae bacterium]